MQKAAPTWKYRMDFTTGNTTKKLLLFSLPMIASMILQNLYNTADAVVVGQYVGEGALAAVGSTNGASMLVLMLIAGPRRACPSSSPSSTARGMRSG